MSKKQEKLFDFNRGGVIIDSDTIIDSKVAIDFVKRLQNHKAMGDNWKIDIFIDENADFILLGPISKSAAYEKGKYEYGLFLNKYFCKGHFRLESKYDVLLASFPTEISAKNAIPHIINFIQYRYNMKIEFRKKDIF